MENLTPLQHCAQELREDFKRMEEEKQKKQHDKFEIEARKLVNNFASSFSTLYSLLIGSNIDVQADVSSVDPEILLTYKANQLSIHLDKGIDQINSWRLGKKAYKATIPNKRFGMAADREDEQRLIIAIEEILFNSKPVTKEQAFHHLQASVSVY